MTTTRTHYVVHYRIREVEARIFLNEITALEYHKRWTDTGKLARDYIEQRIAHRMTPSDGAGGLYPIPGAPVSVMYAVYCWKNKHRRASYDTVGAAEAHCQRLIEQGAAKVWPIEKRTTISEFLEGS